MYRGGVKKKKKIKYGKTNSSRPFLAHPAGGQETPFYLRVALVTWNPVSLDTEANVCF